MGFTTINSVSDTALMKGGPRSTKKPLLNGLLTVVLEQKSNNLFDTSNFIHGIIKNMYTLILISRFLRSLN